MDRNLGARDTKRAVDAKGALSYQCGRKDPFAGGITQNITTAYVGRGEQGDNDIWSIELEGSPVPIFNSVNNPMVFYSSSDTNWASGVDSEVYVWNDFETDVANQEKSIFDPSPKGWKIAPYGTWANLSLETMTDWNDGSIDGQNGRRYPRGDNPFAYYPAYGYRNSSANTYNYSTINHTWTSTPSTTIATYRLYFASSLVQIDRHSYRTAAMDIRCVQHYE